MSRIPRILFVMGKGGTGRSSVAAALGSVFAARGETTLLVEWTFAEAIAPWFGQSPAGHEASAASGIAWEEDMAGEDRARWRCFAPMSAREEQAPTGR